MSREDIYYEAMRTRDHRFDGKFFVGVKTTGIYCRPICPARPLRRNVEFFATPLEAEKKGYRPCLRCRPEAAPLSPAWMGTSAIVRRAARALSTRDSLEFDEDQFAELFGVSARHLRRLFRLEIGKTPKQLAFENRLNLARKLIAETSLPLGEVALASGFSSVRRFNDAFKNRFKRRPSEVRRGKVNPDRGLRVTIPYRPPFDYEGLLKMYASHQVGSLEWFTENSMHRLIEFGGKTGEIAITNDSEHSCLVVEVDFPDTSVLHVVIGRVRALFDLDSDPAIIANHLEMNPYLKGLLKKFPGVRLPSGWDPFETAVATILGQLVSVKRGRSLVTDLIELLGKEVQTDRSGRSIKNFPSPRAIANSELVGLKTTRRRRATLNAFASAVAEGKLSLEPTQPVDEFAQQLMAIPGIGAWTANYMALRVLRDTDAFPASDLIISRSLRRIPTGELEQIRPWRGYAAALMWREHGWHTNPEKDRYE